MSGNRQNKAVVLNFSQSEKSAVEAALKGFPKKNTSASFEEKRWLVNGCTVTLYSTGKLVVQGNACKPVAELILKRLHLREELVLGIDEAGRGESKGVFTISAVLADKNRMRELRDSKKTRNIEKKSQIVMENCIASVTAIFSPEFIDLARESGITMNELQRRFIVSVPKLFELPALKFKVRVDGSPLKGSTAEFIVGGDDKCPVIGAASILAKLARNSSANQKKRKTWKGKN